MKIPPEFIPQTQETPADFGIVEPTSAVYPLAATQVAAAGGDVVTVPSPEYWRIDKVSLYNDNAATETITVFLVDDGGTAAATNKIAEESVASKATASLDYLTGVVMAPGQKLHMNAVNSDSVVVGGFTRFFRGNPRD